MQYFSHVVHIFHNILLDLNQAFAQNQFCDMSNVDVLGDDSSESGDEQEITQGRIRQERDGDAVLAQDEKHEYAILRRALVAHNAYKPQLMHEN
jgi:hypothetical protein